MQINQDKLARQLIGVGKVIDNFKKGLGATLEYCTGFGKTFTTFIIIEKMLVRDPNRSTVIIVPTEQLRDQWEKKIKQQKIKNAKVYVINGVTINEIKLKGTLLVLDEIHRFASDIFSRIFELVEYEFLLGLTATVNRLDGRHDLLIDHASVVDTITLAEAKKNKWVSDYKEYNLGIDLTSDDRQEYDRINREFHKYFAFFGHDFELAMKCTGGKATKHIAEKFAEEGGHDIRKVIVNGLKFSQYMRERKTYLYKTLAKLDVVMKLIELFPLKTVTFSESTEFADRLTEAINNKYGEISMSYHSNLETRMIEGKKFGKDKLKKMALKKFSDNRYKVRIINTAKALDQGFDVEDVMIAIVTSSTSNPTQHIQRVGRAIRNFISKNGDRKIALIVNVYIKNSQDEKWLRKRQTDPKTKRPINFNVQWINNIEEIEYGEVFTEGPIVSSPSQEGNNLSNNS